MITDSKINKVQAKIKKAIAEIGDTQINRSANLYKLIK